MRCLCGAGSRGGDGPALLSIITAKAKEKHALDVRSRIVRPARHDRVVKESCLDADASRRIDIEDPVHGMGLVRGEPSRGKEERVISEALCTCIVVHRLGTSQRERNVGLRLSLIDAENVNRGAYEKRLVAMQDSK